MHPKDSSEKLLESCDDVFADIVNGFLFHGEQIILPGDVKDVLPRSVYKSGGRIHEQERDTIKLCRNTQIRLALIGLENQTEEDRDMPLRIIGYDGASYRSELLEKDVSQRYPVITSVIYLGDRHRWHAPKKLSECFAVPDVMRKYFHDYSINVFEPAFMSDEQLNLFHSDFRILADYLVQMHRYGHYVPDDTEIRHVPETLELMQAMTQGEYLEGLIQTQSNRKDGSVTMRDFLDEAVDKGRAEGMVKGKAEGKAEGRFEERIEVILKLMEKQHITFNEAADLLDCKEEEKKNIREYLDRIQNN